METYDTVFTLSYLITFAIGSLSMVVSFIFFVVLDIWKARADVLEKIGRGALVIALMFLGISLVIAMSAMFLLHLPG